MKQNEPVNQNEPELTKMYQNEPVNQNEPKWIKVARIQLSK